MATGLLGGVLPYIYSRADALKRTLGDVVSNPMESVEQVVNYANDRARVLNQLQAQVASQGVKGLMSPQGQKLANLYAESYEPIGMTAKSVSSKFNVVKRDASDIFGAGSERVRYTEPKSGGSIEVLSKPDGSASILSLEVPEKFRGQKIGESLQTQVMQDFPEFGGQFSSKAAAKGAYRLGLRPPTQPNATFDDVLKMIDEDSSVNMVTPQMQSRFTQQSPYPQQAALDLAQQRAALPVEQGGLGLPATNTAADRAKAMGFEESGYSGTSKDFINYDPSKSSGAGSGSREGALGAWLTDDPRVASEFANWSSRGQGGDVVYPLMIRGSNPYQPSAYSEIKDILDANTQFSRPPYRMMQDKINYENAIRDLEAKGDYVALRNTLTDAIDNPITQFLVTDPTRLRSRFAAFDPFRKDVATATAMGVALPDLLAQPVNQYEPTYETIPMYTDPFGNTIGSSIR